MNDDASARGQAVVAALGATIEAAAEVGENRQRAAEVHLTDVRRHGAADLRDNEIVAALRDLEALGYVDVSEERSDVWLPTEKAAGGVL